jgi:hypothetical protein
MDIWRRRGGRREARSRFAAVQVIRTLVATDKITKFKVLAAALQPYVLR